MIKRVKLKNKINIKGLMLTKNVNENKEVAYHHMSAKQTKDKSLNQFDALLSMNDACLKKKTSNDFLIHCGCHGNKVCT